MHLNRRVVLPEGIDVGALRLAQGRRPSVCSITRVSAGAGASPAHGPVPVKVHTVAAGAPVHVLPVHAAAVGVLLLIVHVAVDVAAGQAPYLPVVQQPGGLQAAETASAVVLAKPEHEEPHVPHGCRLPGMDEAVVPYVGQAGVVIVENVVG